MVLRWCFDNIGEGSDTEEIATTTSFQDLSLGAIQSRIWRGWVAVCFAVWDSFTPVVQHTATSRARRVPEDHEVEDVRNNRKRRRYI